MTLYLWSRPLACALLLAAAVPLAAQTSYNPPKTPWGDPDLQGIWPGNMGVQIGRAHV